MLQWKFEHVNREKHKIFTSFPQQIRPQTPQKPYKHLIVLAMCTLKCYAFAAFTAEKITQRKLNPMLKPNPR